jgi:hypothetical protein
MKLDSYRLSGRQISGVGKEGERLVGEAMATARCGDEGYARP